MAQIHELFKKHNAMKIKISDRMLRFGNRLGQNLIKAGFFIQRESMKIVPIWKGNLRGSAFTRFTGSGLRTQVEVGYTAAYALFVHENLENAHGLEFNTKHADKIAKVYTKTHTFIGPLQDGKKRKTTRKTVKHPYYFNRGPPQQAKFLSTAILANVVEIIAIIKRGIVE